MVYLCLPSPQLPQLGEKYPPEPGFTSDLIGEPSGTYFTNLEKDEAVNFYAANFSSSPFLGLPLPTRIIEHRPEYANEIINDMHNAKNTSFLIEINHPLKESIIIKGYGEINKKDREEKADNEVRTFTPSPGEVYFLKITPYQIKPTPGQRFLSWLVMLLIIPPVIVFFEKQAKEAGKAIGNIFQKNPNKKTP